MADMGNTRQCAITDMYCKWRSQSYWYYCH